MFVETHFVEQGLAQKDDQASVEDIMFFALNGVTCLAALTALVALVLQ